MGTQRALGSSSSQPAITKRCALRSPRAKGGVLGIECPVGAWDVFACAGDSGAVEGDAVGVVWGQSARVCRHRCSGVRAKKASASNAVNLTCCFTSDTIPAGGAKQRASPQSGVAV